jgi:hypothetical protein
MMDAKQVAQWLKVSTRTIARLDEALRPTKVGTRKRYSRDNVEAYLNGRVKDTNNAKHGEGR